MSALVISAFPGCGKTTFYNGWRNSGKRILDSDSSLFSWIYDEEGNKTDKRNPDFPNNYIRHIKEHLETTDIIFISSHKAVRDALKENGISYYLIFPRKEAKEEWMCRFKERGNDASFIEFQDTHWDEFINDMVNDTYPTKIILGITASDGFITMDLVKVITHIEDLRKNRNVIIGFDPENYEECLKAVKHDAIKLKYVSNQTPELCMEAIKRFGRALQFVKEQTPEICQEAIKNNPHALQYVRVQTSKFCMEAVKRDGLTLQYVRDQTPEICLEAVKENGYALKFVIEQTPEICQEAIRSEPFALKYVKDLSMIANSSLCVEE